MSNNAEPLKLKLRFAQSFHPVSVVSWLFVDESQFGMLNSWMFFWTEVCGELSLLKRTELPNVAPSGN
ncbi:MAG: hypothetical protein ACREBI_04340 [Nitrosotalea sp.]